MRGNHKRIKEMYSDASHRIIPIHPKLKEAGFMEYVASIKERGEKHLFPELPRDKYGNYSSIYSKWFWRFLRSVEAKTEKTSFHSFRHNFRDAMREAEI